MKTRIFTLIIAIFVPLTILAQTTYVPDDNFEQALINEGYDDVLDDYVLTSNIDHITHLDIGFRGIYDITGIGGFAALEVLVLNNNYLTALDLSNNTVLRILECNSNDVATLDVSNSPQLTTLEISSSELTSLDLSNNPNLTKILVDRNFLTSLDLSNMQALEIFHCQHNNLASLSLPNTAPLTEMWCNDNQLTSLSVPTNSTLTYLNCSQNILPSLDLSNSTAIVELECSQNQLTSIDFSANPTLERLYCYSNGISTIEISQNTALTHFYAYANFFFNLDVSQNTALTHLQVQEGHLEALDVSNNPLLVELQCWNSHRLTTLNVSNGNNTNFTSFDATNCLQLTCIGVDNAAWSDANWPNKDAGASYSEDCSNGLTYVPDNNFEQALIDLGYDDVLDDYVLTANINTVTNLYIPNKNITDLTGIEDFTSLRHLDCNHNSITALDISQNLELTHLDCWENLIPSLDVSNNTNLKNLYCYHNQLTELDVTNNLALRRLYIGKNQITSIDLSKNIALVDLRIWVSPLSSLDVSKNTLLTELRVYSNQLTSIDVSKNLELQNFYCFENQITTLDVTTNSKLNLLHCFDNQLASMNLSNGNNTLINDFDARNNPNLICIQVDDAAWSASNWTNIDSQTSFSENCGFGSNDTDGDGIADNMDDYPNDATKAFNNYFPAGGFGSLAFEDMWPGKGDYDFNDVVVDYQFLTVTNASNKVVEVTGTFAVKASGAGMENGFGFNLPDANNSFAASPETFIVSGYDLQEGYVSLNSSGHEENQSKPTIIVFDNVYNILPHAGSAIGVNTEESAPFVPYDTLHISITTQTLSYTATDFSLETWNPFIIVNQNRTHEIHLPNYAPTDLADVSMFGMQDDNSDPSIGRYYKTANNLPWAINITSEFSWPVEKVSIDKAYLHFIEWAESSGEQYNDWYNNVAGYTDESKIYDPE